MFPSLYAILDPALIEVPLAEFAAKLAAAGVGLIQLRDKRASARRLLEETRGLIVLFTSTSVRLVVNDRPDVAAMAGAGGVHVGQEDLPVEAARAICGTGRWVGISTHNLAQLREAAGTSADYIAVGPIFPTATKQNPDPVVGIDFLREARKLTRKPLVAIGGITIESAADIFRAGADSVAVIRDLAAAPDPAQRARDYLAVAKVSRSGPA
ncbi:MAG TPA: thiamine phosphate synthase [Candidatus Acidoferrum sp.]|nr:thiamine phosphate synthase [Candidatus Acidoferrum sp.]